jgi:glutaminyl-tRNA synthetase
MDFLHHLAPESLVVLQEARVEPSVADDPADTRYQFERVGYFWRDPVDGVGERLVFNRIESLRDTWGKAVRDAEARDAEVRAAELRDAEVSAAGDDREAHAAAGPPARPAPDPEPQFRVSDERQGARRADPELAARHRRYREELGLDKGDADILTGSRAVSDLFEDALEVHAAPASVAAWVVNEVLRELKERPAAELPFRGRDVGRLVALVDGGRLSRVAAKTVFSEMVASGADPEAVVRERGLAQVSDPSELEPLVARVLDGWPAKVAEYREGKSGLLGFFVGEVMKASRGKADPTRVRAMLERRLQPGP